MDIILAVFKADFPAGRIAHDRLGITIEEAD